MGRGSNRTWFQLACTSIARDDPSGFVRCQNLRCVLHAGWNGDDLPPGGSVHLCVCVSLKYCR